MSGHSKWNNIKNRKGAVDAKRGKVFSAFSKLIKTATKEGKSGDPNHNPSLRLIIDKARASNMPNVNIQRAIDRGLGRGKGGAIQEIIYEGFAPGGVGMLIVAQTDNPQRTAGEVRAALSKAGGSLGGPGTAMYLFERKGEDYLVNIPMELSDSDLEQIEKLENLVETLRQNDDVEDVYTAATWSGKDQQLDE